MVKCEVVIIGGGPAGLTAGLYTSRAGLKSLLIERSIFGGQMANVRSVENYPGFPEGVSGYDLGESMLKQAAKYGLQTMSAEVTGLVPGTPQRVSTNDGDVEADAVVIAAGSDYYRLNVPGEDRLLGRGVSYCATCDGALFRDLNVAVIGGGDTAITDALELSQLARKVYVIHRRGELRAGHVLQQRAFAEPRIEFIWNAVADEILGEKMVAALRLRDVRSNELSTIQVDGVFAAIGLRPNSQHFAGVVKLTEAGHVAANELMMTSVPGVFAAGDIRSNSPRQISTAVGDGATAAMSVMKHLRG